VKIAYPNVANLTINGLAQYYKFDLRNLSYIGIATRCDNNTVILRIKDGSIFDEDRSENGVIEDDGGISKVENWFVNGNGNVRVIDNVTWINLTQDINDQSSSVWFYQKVNISKSFEIRFKVYLGVKDDNGADGIAFVLHNDSRGVGALGGGGGDLGYSGISPSVAVEIDTYQNSIDPLQDHIAIDVNGNLSHTYNNQTYGTPQPVEIGNVEDRNEHDVRIVWFAENNTLKVYFDGELKLNWTKNVVDEIFGGSPLVYWGFTGATGGLNNTQYVKLYKFAYIERMVIKGRVFEDFGTLGVKDDKDVGIPNVQVGLFKDLNGNGKPEPSELIKTTTTNETGYYEFEINDTFATYIIAVNSKTVNTTLGLNPSYTDNHIWAEQTFVTTWVGLRDYEWYNNSNASVTVDRIVLTPNEGGKVGSAWFYKKIDLSKDFVVKFKAYLGNRDGGADGITFVLHNDSHGFSAIGWGGGSLGYSGISPSVAVEFDTWQNGELGDLEEDHIAIDVNGNLNHTYNNQTYTPQPVGIGNVEDGLYHDVAIKWNATTKTLYVYFDGQLKLIWQKDIVKEIFGEQDGKSI